jgi:hypothetical protein
VRSQPQAAYSGVSQTRDLGPSAEAGMTDRAIAAMHLVVGGGDRAQRAFVRHRQARADEVWAAAARAGYELGHTLG